MNKINLQRSDLLHYLEDQPFGKGELVNACIEGVLFNEDFKFPIFFKDSNLTNCRFGNSQRQFIFENCVIRNTLFDDTYVLKINNSNLYKCTISDCHLSLGELVGSELEDVKFVNNYMVKFKLERNKYKNVKFEYCNFNEDITLHKKHPELFSGCKFAYKASSSAPYTFETD